MSDEPLPVSESPSTATAVPTDIPSPESEFPAGSAQWPPTLRYGVGIVLLAICVLGLLLVLPLLQVILISFLIAFIMFIPSRAISRRFRLPYGLSVIIAFLIAAGIVAALIVLLLPDVIGVLESLRNTLHQGIAQLLAELQNPPATIEVVGQTIDTGTLNVALREVLQAADSANLGSSLAHSLFGLFGSVAAMAAAIGTASVVALFFLIGLPISGGTMTNWIPGPYRREIALLFGKLDTVWLKFFRAFIIIGVITGAASLGLFWLFGIVGAILVAPIMGSVRVFMQFSIAKILLRDPYPGEEVLPLLEEGFFSHMLYVKKKKKDAAETEV